MLHRVLAIALNTYRESVRARILLGLAGVAFAVSFYSLIVGAFTLRNAPRVVSDLGVASISLFSILVAIIIGSTSLHRELEQKTIFPILARPIRRGEYLVGKYLGTLLTIAVFIMADAGLVLMLGAASGATAPELIGRVAVTGGVLVLALTAAAVRSPKARTYGPIPWSMLVLAAGVVLSAGAPDERRVVLGGCLLALLEVAVVSAIGMVFASFSTPFLSALFTAAMVVIGREADTLTRFPVKYFGKAFHDAAVVLSKIVPNLHVFVPPRPLFTGEVVGVPLASYLSMAAVTSVAWSVGLLAVAAFIFRKRDFL